MDIRTLRDALTLFDHYKRRIDNLFDQTVVHREKFDFFLRQFEQFCDTLSRTATDDSLTAAQGQAIQHFGRTIIAVCELYSQSQADTWANPTLEQRSSAVIDDLLRYCGYLRTHARTLSPAAAGAFREDDSEWMRCHVEDLRLIQASFREHISSAPTSAEFALVAARLQSIDVFLADKDGAGEGGPVIPVEYRRWRIEHSSFEAMREISQGPLASVWYGQEKGTGKELAIKRFVFEALKPAQVQAYRREVSVLVAADHPTLLRFVGATDSAPYCIVTEYLAGGTLFNELHKYRKLTASQLTIAAFDIARGMKFLHGRSIIHRDLKSANILLDGEGFVRIGDFGLSKPIDPQAVQMTQFVGTVNWMAPEMLENSGYYDEKIDVYSYGILLWELVSRQIPFAGLETGVVISQVLRRDNRPPIPDNVSPTLRNLIQQCWDRNPDNRPSFSEVCEQFRNENVFLPGAIPEEVRIYVQRYLPAADADGGEESPVVADAENVRGILTSIETGALPARLHCASWRVIEEAGNAPIFERIRTAFLFLQTSQKDRALAWLRKAPAGSIPLKLAKSLIDSIGEGSSPQHVQSAVVIACKNGAADWALVRCPKEYASLKKLAFEVVAAHGPDRSLEAAVCDVAMQNIGSSDPSMACAALRCLVSAGGASRLAAADVARLMRSDDSRVRLCAVMAATKLVLEGKDLNDEVLDLAIQMAEHPRAATLIALMGRAEPIGRALATQLLERRAFDLTLSLRILLAAAAFPTNRELVGSVLTRLDFAPIESKWQDALERLRAVVAG
jgi:hypothetical protein